MCLKTFQNLALKMQTKIHNAISKSIYFHYTNNYCPLKLKALIDAFPNPHT
jgi:hypothetical protein